VKRELDFYLRQQYPVILRPLTEEEGGGWLAEIPELPGCMSDGETREEALKNLEDAKKAWLRTALKRGQEIPLPKPGEEEYSGRLTLRMPRSFHRQLAQAAGREGVSLNQFILTLLSLGYGALCAGSLQKMPRLHIELSLFPGGVRPESEAAKLARSVLPAWQKYASFPRLPQETCRLSERSTRLS